VPCYCKNRWTNDGSAPASDGAASPALPLSTSAAAAADPSLANSASISRSGAHGAYSLRAPAPAELAWADLTCSVADLKTLAPKVILQPDSGVVVPGELCALVGPSGAGKSTLLDMLAGRKTTGKLGGHVLMSGRPVGRTFKRTSAYVAQEDVFVPTMTARETLRFHAKLRAERGTPLRALEERMDAVLETMGLARAANTAVGGMLPTGIAVRGLSGGERRRLTIACSLVALPSILFLDEPTTGLDSFAAYNIMEHMARLAAGGHAVIATIHQPRQSIWDMFHKVLVLSEGHQLFFGPPDAAVGWFDRGLGYPYQAARDGAASDWLMDLVSVGFAKPDDVAARSMSSRADVAAAAAAFAARGGAGGAPFGGGSSSDAAEDAALVAAAARGGTRPPRPSSAAGTSLLPAAALSDADGARARAAARARLSGRYPSSYWTQFRVLFHRSGLAQLRNPTDVTSRLMLSCWVGTFAGLVFVALERGAASSVFQRLAVLFFTMMTFQLLPFCYMSLYVADRAFYAADVAAGLYHPLAYYVANSLASGPFVVLNTLIGGFAAYGLAALKPGVKHVVIYGLLQSLQALTAVQLMVFAVYLTPNQVRRKRGERETSSTFFCFPARFFLNFILLNRFSPSSSSLRPSKSPNHPFNLVQDIAYVLAVAYVTVSILLGGFYIRIFEIPFAILRYISFLSYPRFTLQGLAINEMRDDVYRPQGCLSASMLGATKAEIDALVSNDTQAEQGRMGGTKCTLVADGNGTMEYWDFKVRVSVAVVFVFAFIV